MMDDESVDHEFFNLAMGDYADSIERFVEFVRVTEHQIRTAMEAEDPDGVMERSQELFLAISNVQVGNLHNLITGFGHALNDERAAGLQVFEILMFSIHAIRRLHQHLVRIEQPNQELIMVTDLIALLQSKVDGTSFGQMAKQHGV